VQVEGTQDTQDPLLILPTSFASSSPSSDFWLTEEQATPHGPWSSDSPNSSTSSLLDFDNTNPHEKAISLRKSVVKHSYNTRGKRKNSVSSNNNNNSIPQKKKKKG